MADKSMQKQGLVFNTGLGQHILKNPLVVHSMIEKASYPHKVITTRDIYAINRLSNLSKPFTRRLRFVRPMFASKSVPVRVT